MPALTDSAAGAGTATGNSGANPVQLGSLRFSWSPHHINRVIKPNVYRQMGINAWLLNDYGMNPVAYVLEGYATSGNVPYWPDPALVAQIDAQFPTPTSVVKLLVPFMGIATTVRRVQQTDDTNSMTAPGEVTFRLDLEEADGPLTSRDTAATA